MDAHTRESLLRRLEVSVLHIDHQNLCPRQVCVYAPAWGVRGKWAVLFQTPILAASPLQANNTPNPKKSPFLDVQPKLSILVPVKPQQSLLVFRQFFHERQSVFREKEEFWGLRLLSWPFTPKRPFFGSNKEFLRDVLARQQIQGFHKCAYRVFHAQTCDIALHSRAQSVFHPARDLHRLDLAPPILQFPQIGRKAHFGNLPSMKILRNFASLSNLPLSQMSVWAPHIYKSISNLLK